MSLRSSSFSSKTVITPLPLIMTGPIKLGMRAEIRIFSEKTHQIPEEGFELASDQYHMIWHDLLHFLKPNKKSSEYPPLICKVR